MNNDLPFELPLDEYHRHSKNNEIEILQSKRCGCLFCRSVFDARRIKDWTNDEGMSAVCPECGMDAVIGDASGLDLSKPVLKEVNLAFFGPDYIKSHPEAAEAYIRRYSEKQITHNRKNETLFLDYLETLLAQGDERAAYVLGEFYERGSEFTPPDPEVAAYYYSNKLLTLDAEALVKLGNLYACGDARGGQKLAFECFSKAAALGSLMGGYHIACCYLVGMFVKKNEELAFGMLKNIFLDAYDHFSCDRTSVAEFTTVAYRIARCYIEGVGVEFNPEEALRHFLLARAGLRTMDASFPSLESSNVALAEEITSYLKALEEKFEFSEEQPIFDQDTFYQSVALFQNDSVKHFRFILFNESENVLEFEVTYERPPLIIDPQSIYGDFVASNTVRWSFHSVAAFRKFGSGDVFERVGTTDDNNWSFFHRESDGKETVIATIDFVIEAEDEDD